MTHADAQSSSSAATARSKVQGGGQLVGRRHGGIRRRGGPGIWQGHRSILKLDSWQRQESLSSWR